MSDETIHERLKHSLVIMKLKDLGVNAINISFTYKTIVDSDEV